MGSEINKKSFSFYSFLSDISGYRKTKKNIQVAIALKNNFELLINENFTNKLKIHSDVLL